jgi:hypothetical protein
MVYRSVVLLPGYDDRGPDDLDGPGLAYDGSELLRQRGFWPAYLGETLELGLDEELAELFGERLDAVRSVYERLTDESAWPVFLIELGSDARAAVVYRNFTEDIGLDYLVIPAGGNSIRIATIEGALDGPGISWPELRAVADRQPTAVERATALLLLSRVLGDEAAESGEAVAQIGAALGVIGVVGEVERIAQAIVSATPAGWHRTANGFNVCDDEGSTRNPSSRAAMKQTDLRTVSALFTGATDGS